MGSIYFEDPKTGKEIELRRDTENPYFKVIQSFRKKSTPSLKFVFDRRDQVALTAFVFPYKCPLGVLPAIRLTRIALESPKSGQDFKINVQLGYANISHIKNFPCSIFLQPKVWDWVDSLWKKQLMSLLSDDLYYSYVNYVRDAGSFGDFDTEGEFCGKLNLNEDQSLSYLKICMGWHYWETNHISWLARTLEAGEMGICKKMEEDNFRNICKKAGFLKPRKLPKGK